MHRDGIIDILNKLLSDIPPGLRRYKLLEQLHMVWGPYQATGRKRWGWVRLPWVGKRLGNRMSKRGEQQQDATVHHTCISCSYHLEGLDSALGDEIYVGPRTCPECGIEFPAIW
jgi:hypothetical protein